MGWAGTGACCAAARGPPRSFLGPELEHPRVAIPSWRASKGGVILGWTSPRQVRSVPPPLRGRPSRGGGYDELMGAGRQDPALLEPPQCSLSRMVPKTAFTRMLTPPSTVEGSELRGSSPQTLAPVPSIQRRQASDPPIPRPQKTLEQRPGSSAPGPSPVGKGRQAPGRRTEPTGGAATSRPRCALSAGPSALPSLAAEGSPRPQFPVAAHPEDEIEDEEQVFDAFGATLHPHGGAWPAELGLVLERAVWGRRTGVRGWQVARGAGGPVDWDMKNETRGREGLEA